MSDYENKITIGELEDGCDDLISDVEEGQVYVVVDDDDEPLAVLIPYSLYEEYRDLQDD